GPVIWKWMDSWPALVVPFLASTFSIFLLRQFFMQIPEDLWDAARIDGAGHFRYLFQIVVPISRAAIVTTVIFAFIGTWNSLEWPLLVTFTDNWRPISYGLYAFSSEAGVDLNKLMAGSVITLVPVLVIYLIAQRQFTEGIATTGLKG
ncbi:MAG: carbohydrate ABC transporter permease, partial [Chloroflexi bacterium]|nr:carbohydrate ABC transporter permease [Chloroflexota bacterium]